MTKNDSDTVVLSKDNMEVITAEHLQEAAKLLGKQLLDSVVNGRQCLLLTDQSYLHRLALGSVNRDVNQKWVAKLKTEMSRLVMARERTVITACIDLREVQRAIEEQNGGADFKAIVLDGQHRVTCLMELLASHPTMKYEFWLQLYIVSSEMEMMQLIEDFDKRLVISAKDKKTMQDRQLFTETFLQMVPKEHHHRRCVTGVLSHKTLRDEKVVEALQGMSDVGMLKTRFHAVAQSYRRIAEENPPKSTSVMAKVLEDTKLYFLMEYDKPDWIYEVVGLKKLRAYEIAPEESFSDTEE